MTNEPSPRPWRVEPSGRVGTDCLFDANGTYIGTVPKIDSALIVDAVNLKARIDEAMADEAGYLRPVVLDGKPMVFVTPPPSEAEESRMHREYEANLLADRERFRRCYYEAAKWNDRLRDIVRRAIPFIEGIANAGALVKADDPDIVPFMTQEQKAAARKAHEDAVPLLAEARAAIGEGETPTGKGVER